MRVSDVLLNRRHNLLCKVLIYVTKSGVVVGDGSLKLLAGLLDSPVQCQHRSDYTQKGDNHLHLSSFDVAISYRLKRTLIGRPHGHQRHQ